MIWLGMTVVAIFFNAFWSVLFKKSLEHLSAHPLLAAFA